MNKQQAIDFLTANGCPQELIADLQNAKNWTNADKQAFVAWASARIGFLSSQPTPSEEQQKALRLANAQYYLYINSVCVNEEREGKK